MAEVNPWSIAALLAALAAAGSLAATTGCGGTPVGNSTDGKLVFQAMCATCHGPDGKPPEAMIARIGVRDLTAPEFRARVTPGLVEHQVRVGSKSKLMPPFEGALSDAQISSVAAFVASPQFVAPPPPPAAPR
jgi:mono/diheme cytochrome c family protein